MDINLVFSLELLRSARRDAKAYGVKLASGLVALQSGRDQWFVQGNGGDAGEYVSGSNAYEARANYISRKIDQANPQLKDELEYQGWLKAVRAERAS